MIQTIKRNIKERFEQYLGMFPAVGLMGPRQSGKSTLAKEVASDYQYVTFDDQSMIDAFYHDPKQFMRRYNDRIIFDEAQKVPELFDAVKIAIDNDRENYGKFILTGSSQFYLMSNITESLAGRIGLLTLLPLQFQEVPEHLHDVSIFKGGYPELVVRDYAYNDEWYGSYMGTYLQKDVRALANIGDIRDFSRLIRLLASNASQLLNYSHYANDLGVSVPTVKRWISVLEASYIIFLLPSFHGNKGKRLIKSPKIYFYDTGLISYLTHIKNQEVYDNGPMKGAIFENYIIAEIVKKELLNASSKELCFYRTSGGQEVDLIIDRMTSKEVIEIKSGYTCKSRMLRSVESLLEEGDQGYLLYNGKTEPAGGRVNILNYKDYFNS